ncbi:MAG TPA: GNAT family protein [Candidatus Limnocylindrales bacterium]|nr:GNAT family protein [Candidatus Limnocylindrales bacterium]
MAAVPTDLVLDGDLVRLRPVAAGDHARLDEILAEPSVARWWTAASEAGPAADWLAGEESIHLVIEAGGLVVGSLQVEEELDPDYEFASIDLFLADAAQGRGLGPDAIRTIARYLIEVRGHHRLTIDPNVANERAIKAYTKVGFRPVGVMRAYERNADGTWHDNLLLDLLAGELT